MFFGSAQRTFADPDQGFYLFVVLSTFQELNRMMQLTALYQNRMVLNGLLDSLRLNADIPLCGGSAAVLQQSLNQDDVKAVGLVDLCGIPFAEPLGRIVGKS